MNVKKLSATSIDRWNDCPASWASYYAVEHRPAELSGPAANMGSVIHRALEVWVQEGRHEMGYDPAVAKAYMRTLYDAAFMAIGQDTGRYNEGLELCYDWLERTDFSKVEVVEVEAETFFEFEVDGEPVMIQTIMDRVDCGPDGLEVVDYKSGVARLGPDDLHGKTQARLYAWIASETFGDEEVWVTFDQLRHQPVSSLFTAEDHQRTRKMVESVVRDIRTTEEPEERLNDRCQWCIRRHECTKLTNHVNAGGPLALDDMDRVVGLRHETAAALKGLKARLEDYDSYLREHGEINEITEWMTQDHTVTLWQGARSKRPMVRIKPLV